MCYSYIQKQNWIHNTYKIKKKKKKKKKEGRGYKRNFFK